MLLRELDSYYRSIRFESGLSANYVRNLLKEQLHFYVLDFLYKHEEFRKLIFYGGTCLRHCFNLPRLSEDLDFEYLESDFSIEFLGEELKRHFSTIHHFEGVVVKSQKFRVYLKFPVLRELGLARSADSDFLHVKVEVNSTKHSVGSYLIELQPLFVMQRTFFVRRYDLSTLMASKINALINRTWAKKNKDGLLISDAKGRDYFDLLWYMQKGIQPRLEFTCFTSMQELWEAIEVRVASVKSKSIQNDLQDFMERPSDASDFALNLREAFAAMRQKYSQHS